MFGRVQKPPPKPTEAMKLSMCVNAAADEFETEKEQWETIEIGIRGIGKYVIECESEARMRGSPRSAGFALVGRAMQSFALGTARIAAALPAADPKSQLAAQVLLGLQEEMSEEVDA